MLGWTVGCAVGATQPNGGAHRHILMTCNAKLLDAPAPHPRDADTECPHVRAGESVQPLMHRSDSDPTNCCAHHAVQLNPPPRAKASHSVASLALRHNWTTEFTVKVTSSQNVPLQHRAAKTTKTKSQTIDEHGISWVEPLGMFTHWVFREIKVSNAHVLGRMQILLRAISEMVRNMLTGHGTSVWLSISY